MKVLIVDDEAHVREGIDLSVSWESYGVTERLMAANGLEALELLKRSQPAVMFCDMKMPLMGGLELLEKIREEGLDTQVIVISGYGDFEYTRATIRANGVDYILKPFRRKDVEEALQKAIQAWREAADLKQVDVDRNFLVRRAEAVLGEKKLAAYFRGEVPLTSSIRSTAEKCGLGGKPLRAVLLLPKNRLEVLNERFMMDDELFSFALENIALYALGSDVPSYLCRLDDYQWLLFMEGTAAGLQGAGHSFYLERLKQAWRHTLRLEMLVGTTPAVAGLEEIHTVIGEARRGLLDSDVLTGSSRNGGAPSGELPHLASEQFLLRKAIEACNKAFAAELVNKHADALRRRGSLRLRELQECTMEANLLLGRWSRLASESSLPPQSLSLPLWINDLDEWRRVLISQMHLLMDSLYQKSGASHSIEEIKDYLDQHFYEEITLTLLAEQFHFSPQYISKKFKDTYQKTIVMYLTDLKIERAKSMLSGTSLSVAEIANQLGYEDENYFSKVFKKQVGVSPSPYRKLHEAK
ncbi:response regulator [Paenibacillus filicis]|uniref:Response regulator n=1 Tax=Paenibacillus filicis TaxID=669464 RepID=A0ABU9DTQ5_9BACL